MAGEKIKIRCSGLTEEGKGILRMKGEELALSGVLPGEVAVLAAGPKGLRLAGIEEPSPDRVVPPCPVYSRCGGCQLQHLAYEAQLDFKERRVAELFQGFGKVSPILGMKDPWSYRHKVHSTPALDKTGRLVSGIYEEDSHRVIPADRCLIQDPRADAIVGSILDLMKEFRLKPYEEDRKRGFLRHVLVRTGFRSGEILVVLVTGDRLFPGRSSFVQALLRRHPEITSVVQNVNGRRTSMVLGEEEKVLYGKGFIEDHLCGKTFRLSAGTFYQVNPEQTEVLYGKALEMAELKGTESVLDAYCGIGTITLLAGDKAKSVLGVELNRSSVRNAIGNAKGNRASNVRFQGGDAGEFMKGLAAEGGVMDVVILDPPRQGSDEGFLSSLVKLMPGKVVYISCNPATQLRDVRYLAARGYQVAGIQPVDMFPQTWHVENIVLLTRV